MALPKLPYPIYWINLDRRQDRRKRMEEHMLTNNVGNHTRITACDGADDYKPYKVKPSIKLRASQNAVNVSHLAAAFEFVNNSDAEFCFIIEDDVENPYEEYWSNYHYELLEDPTYEILQLQTSFPTYWDGRKHMRYENTNSGKILKPVTGWAPGATIYRLSRNAAFKRFSNHTVDGKYYDVSCCHKPNDNTIWTSDGGRGTMIPMFCYAHDSSDSDNANVPDEWVKKFKAVKQTHKRLWTAKNFHTFCINMDSHTNRLQHFESQLVNAGLGNIYERVSAIVGADLDFEDIPLTDESRRRLIKSEAAGVRTRDEDLTLGAVGCYLSHLKVWELIVEKNIDYALVFEDDVMLPSYTAERVVNYLRTLPEDWDIVYFGSVKHEFSNVTGFDSLCKLTNFWLTHSSLVSNRGARKILESNLLLPIERQLDHALSRHTNFLNIYQANDIQTSQNTKNFKTTIQSRVIN